MLPSSQVTRASLQRPCLGCVVGQHAHAFRSCITRPCACGISPLHRNTLCAYDMLQSRCASLRISANLLCDMAFRATHVAEVNDNRSAFKIVRLLRGFKDRQLRSIRLLDGTIASSSDQCAERWGEHFVELCTGQVLGDASSTITPPPQPLPVSTSRPPPPPKMLQM